MITINLTQRNVICLFAVITTCVLLAIAFSLWQWRHDWLLTHQADVVNPPNVKTNQIALMINAIPNEHLFGSHLGEAPITNLQFRVTGIVKTEGDVSKAYISTSGQPGKIYHVGDKLPYGVKIYDITENTVLLENEGRIEKLPLPRDPLKFKHKNEEHQYA